MGLALGALREAVSVVAGATAALCCWTVALSMIGASPEGMGPAALAFAAVFAVDAHLSERFPRIFRSRGVASSAQSGFLVAFTVAAAAVHWLHEDVAAASNLADAALCGLSLGMPGGVACAWAMKDSKKIVDTLFGGP